MIRSLRVVVLTVFSAYLRARCDGSCTVVPMEEPWADYQVARLSTGRARKYWCQANCPVAASVSDGQAICPFFDPSGAAQNCSDFSFSEASSCNQGFSGAACPPAFGPTGGGCLSCVQSEMQCSTCGSAALCSKTNGFSVSQNGVTNSLGGCDNSVSELTSCAGRETSPCGYVCTGRCERGFTSSWNCNLEGETEVITRCERATVDDANAGCDVGACDNGCMSVFLRQVQAGEISGWELSYPLGNGTDSNANTASKAQVSALSIAILAIPNFLR